MPSFIDSRLVNKVKKKWLLKSQFAFSFFYWKALYNFVEYNSTVTLVIYIKAQPHISYSMYTIYTCAIEFMRGVLHVSESTAFLLQSLLQTFLLCELNYFSFIAYLHGVKAT